MYAMEKLLVALVTCFLVAVFASQSSAQPDTQATPPNPARMSAHREAALRKCTDGIKFESNRYVTCMMAEGEQP